jgi:hypothetical protein
VLRRDRLGGLLHEYRREAAGPVDRYLESCRRPRCRLTIPVVNRNEERQLMACLANYNITIKATQAKVFDYVADVSRHGEWGMDDMKVVPDKKGPPAVGMRYKAEGLLMGKVNPSVVKITDYDRPKRLAFDAEDKNSVFHHEFLFTADGDGTRVERQVTMPKGPWYNPIMMTIFKGTVVKNYDGALKKVRAKLEA